MDVKEFLQMIAGSADAVLIRSEAAGGGNVQEHWVEPQRSTAEGLKDFFQQLSEANKRNVWFQIGPTKPGDKTPEIVNVMWADVDVYKYPGGELQAMGLLRYLPKPSVIVKSGSGYHIYWKLKTPMSAVGLESPASGLAKSVQSFLGADAAHSTRKLLRVPGTLNFKPNKYEGGKLCEIVQVNDVEYDPAEFPSDHILDRVPHKLRVKLMLGPEEANLDRSEYDYLCAAELFKNGFTEDEIKYLMRTYPFSGKIKEGVPSVENYVSRTVKSAMMRVQTSGGQLKIRSKSPAKWVGMTLTQILEEHKPPFIINDFLPDGGLAMLAAPPKARKSWAVMQMAYAVSMGESWLGFEVDKPQKVLYVQAELPNWMVAERFKQMYGVDALENLTFYHIPSSNLLDDEDLQGLLDQVIEHDAKLVIIDPIANFWQGDENSSSSVNQLFDQFARIQALGCAVVLVHHTRKTEFNERLSPQHQRGSNVFFARPAAVVTLSPIIHPGEVPFTWVDFALRAAPPKEPFKVFVDDSGKFTTLNPSLGDSASPVRRHLLELRRKKENNEPTVMMYKEKHGD